MARWRGSLGPATGTGTRRRGWRCPAGNGGDLKRNHSRYVLASPTPSLSQYSSSKRADGNYWRVQHIIGGHAFSETFSSGSLFLLKSLLNHRSIYLQAGEQTRNNENMDAFPNQQYQRSDKSAILENENEDLASNEFSESNLEEDTIEIAESYLDLSETEMASHGAEAKSSTCPLFKVLMKSPCTSVKDILEKWIEDGHILDHGEASVTMLNLRKRQLYGKALQFVEWLEARKCLNVVEQDYASHLDLVAKVHGLQQAETYINEIPASFRGEVIYRTFLANCVSALNVRKAEEVLTTMRDIGLPITTFVCDQLLLLYKRVDTNKVPNVLLMMEKESIKPSIFTYRLLIDLNGRSYDITGMEQIVEKMKAEGMWPDLIIQSTVVGFYMFGGITDKAEEALREMEGDIKENRDVCKILLPLYAALGKADDVGRVWKVCEGNPRVGECLAAIEAWGKVGHVEKAEEVFEKILKSWNTVSSECYNALLRVYANHKLLCEGEDLVKRMKQSGCRIGPSTCDALVKLYAEAGEVQKADITLLREAEKYKFRPLHASYLTLLKEYSKRGDVHNAEKIFHRLRQTRFRHRMKLHQLLLEAYLNAKRPAYGFRERMQADYIFPNKQLDEILAAVDALWKTQVPAPDKLDIELSFICSNPHKSSPSLYECWSQTKK